MKLPTPHLLFTAALVAALASPFAPLVPVAQAQQIALEPADTVLAGDPLVIRFTGLPEGAEVQVSTRRQVREFTGAQRPYAAQARFRSSPSGTLDLATAAPLPGGSYSGADLRGLFWSMQPAPAAPAAGADALAEGQVEIELRAVDATGQPGARLAARRLSFLLARPEVVSRPADGFPGALFSSLPGAEPRPALIILGGSEGGTMILRDGPVWASRGYAVLALPYYSPPGWGPNGPIAAQVPALPPAFADIPVERLEQARGHQGLQRLP
jgi:hypothetical protein